MWCNVDKDVSGMCVYNEMLISTIMLSGYKILYINLVSIQNNSTDNNSYTFGVTRYSVGLVDFKLIPSDSFYLSAINSVELG